MAGQGRSKGVISGVGDDDSLLRAARAVHLLQQLPLKDQKLPLLVQLLRMTLPTQLIIKKIPSLFLAREEEGAGMPSR